MRGPIVGTAILLFNPDYEILLAKGIGKHANGEYGTPGGRVEPGESLFDCIKRETFEETKLVIEPQYLGFTASDVYVEEDMHCICHWFAAQAPAGRVSFIETDANGNPKNEGWAWWKPDYLPTPLMRSIREAVEFNRYRRTPSFIHNVE